MRNLIIKLASAAQREVCIQREYQGYSGGLSRQSFDARKGDIAGQSGYWSKGKRRWVLVPEEDPETLEVLSSCATHRRPCLVKIPSQPLQRSVSYGIAHVFTPEKHRRNGYAALLMTLLHQQLNPKGTLPMPSRRNENLEPPPIADVDEEESKIYGRDAAASHLYSAIGDYYEPYGWKITGIETTSWKVKDGEEDSEFSEPGQIRDILESDLASFSELDEKLLISELQSTPFEEDEEGNPQSRSRIAIVDPDAEAWKSLVIKAKAFAKEVMERKEEEIPTIFGCSIGDRSWCVWSIDYQKLELQFLRHRISKQHPEDLHFILQRANKVAREQKLEWIKAWNVDQEILKKSERAGDESKTEKRNDSLASLCTYGNWGKDVQWFANECGFYC